MTIPKIQTSRIVLPCHSLEDFPVHHTGENADSLLANWTALWHPGLIHACQARPQWCRADQIPDDLTGHLLLVPSVSMDELPAGFSRRIQRESASVLVGCRDRNEALEWIEDRFPDGDQPCPALVNDFLALGYSFLQIELMTRQLRGVSNLEETPFDEQLVNAANAWMSGDEEGAKSGLTGCFDLLAEEKNNFYPVPTDFMELVLTTEATLGNRLKAQVGKEVPVQNWMLTGSAFEELKKNREWWVDLAASLGNGEIRIVGGVQDELEFPLMDVESLHHQNGLVQPDDQAPFA